ncbi:uncharacterized protein LOC136028622 [Artemia franciscana]|uniref:Uncharacterized protein n=1 Tax=Artemia franciscana TaxID=6661 RepID=A0AA88HHB6_ARTSF|nr:hypothetical protein QYM36_014903 [Artemia franciscana]
MKEANLLKVLKTMTIATCIGAILGHHDQKLDPQSLVLRTLKIQNKLLTHAGSKRPALIGLGSLLENKPRGFSSVFMSNPPNYPVMPLAPVRLYPSRQNVATYHRDPNASSSPVISAESSKTMPSYRYSRNMSITPESYRVAFPPAPEPLYYSPGHSSPPPNSLPSLSVLHSVVPILPSNVSPKKLKFGTYPTFSDLKRHFKAKILPTTTIPQVIPPISGTTMYTVPSPIQISSHAYNSLQSRPSSNY